MQIDTCWRVLFYTLYVSAEKYKIHEKFILPFINIWLRYIYMLEGISIKLLKIIIKKQI